MTEDRIQQLRLERRSYIIGSLVVWVVILATLMILTATMEPQLFALPRATSVQEVMARVAKAGPLTQQQQLVIQLVILVGAVALFFLNWRFSYLLQRPRGAFAAATKYPAGRWLWWAALALNSYFFLPQVLVTPLLAYWGKQEIARLSAHPPSPEVHV